MTAQAPLYDRIGLDYANLRRPDPRIAARIDAALADARSVLNVGAGAGSYEPAGREVTALEPSSEMIAQRPPGSAPVVQASAEAMPFPNDAFDAAMAVLTVHHWSDQPAGLREMRRVARGPVVVLTFEQGHPGSWLGDHFPAIRELDAGQTLPFEEYRRELGEIEVQPVIVPHDCTDGFLYAYWRRPEAYLDPRVRAGSSTFHVLDGLESGLARLAADLADGTWHRCHEHLLDLEEYDAGYRLVIAR